jgi:hypothetical protein
MAGGVVRDAKRVMRVAGWARQEAGVRIPARGCRVVDEEAESGQ